jgi:hypothetical protein
MAHVSDAVQALDRDLRELFGLRLKSLVAYGAREHRASPTSTLAIVDQLTAEDLRAAAARVAGWHDAGLNTPLLVAEEEFGRSLDAFPFEFGGILAEHVLVSGNDPFEGLRVDPADLRRACEVQARSHLLHLREGYLETLGRGDAIVDLLSRSAAPLAALLKSVARLHGSAAADLETAARQVEDAAGLARGSLAEVAALTAETPLSSERARDILAGHLTAIGRLTNYIDRWTVNDR